MDYGKILKGAWKTIWNHKVILWFGYLMMIPSLIMGIVMGVFFFFFNEEYFSFIFEPYASPPDISPLFPILLIIVGFGFTLLSYALIALSFAGVLKGTLDLKKREDKISFGELWGLALPYFGRILGVILLTILALFVLILLPMFLTMFLTMFTAGIGMLCMIPLFLLILPLELLAYLFISIAMAAIVAEDLGVFNAIKRAWEVTKKKFWSLILMTIILLFAQFLLYMIIMIPMQIAQFFIMFSMDLTSTASPDPDTFFRPFFIMMALFIPLISLFQGFGLTYANAAWMLTYLASTSKPEMEME